MKDIQLTLTLEEVNTLLNALGDQPYNQIHLLIAKIQSQGVHSYKPYRMVKKMCLKQLKLKN